MLIKYMVGRELGQDYPKRTTSIGKPVLEVENIANHKVHNCSFILNKGEILGIAGLIGAGRTELARAIFGADPINSGSLKINGKEITINNPKDAIKCGIGLIPEDRKSQGLLLNKGIDFNIVYASMKYISRNGFIQKAKEKETTEKYSKAMDIKSYSAAQITRTLSGGNQQKVVLGKWLATKCDILIFDEPTRGIDVGAKSEIYMLMRSLIEEGKSIIMISSELPELIGISDRVLVMRDGQIKTTLSGSDITQENIMEFAAE
jgi:ribose transport system ATP-binding protein